MGEVIIETDVPREKDYIYYCGTDKKGNITVCKAKMVRGRKKKDKKGNK